MFDKAVETALVAEAPYKDGLMPNDHTIVRPRLLTSLNKVAQMQQPHKIHLSHSIPTPKTDVCGGRHLASGCPCKELFATSVKRPRCA